MRRPLREQTRAAADRSGMERRAGWKAATGACCTLKPRPGGLRTVPLPHWWTPAERAPQPAPARSHLRRHTSRLAIAKVPTPSMHWGQRMWNSHRVCIAALKQTHTHLVINRNLGACWVYPPASRVASAAAQKSRAEERRSRQISHKPSSWSESSSATHMVFGALVNRLNVTLHLQDLWQGRTSWISWCRQKRASLAPILLLTFLVSSSAGSGVGVFTEGGTMGDFTASCWGCCGHCIPNAVRG